MKQFKSVILRIQPQFNIPLGNKKTPGSVQLYKCHPNPIKIQIHTGKAPKKCIMIISIKNNMNLKESHKALL